jgi:hypothetical protein
MRQLNIAQRSANNVASVRDCAFVVGNKVRLLLQHLLLHAQLGTSSKSTGYERPEIYSWSRIWMGIMWPAMTPATCTIPVQTTGKRGS